MSIRNASVGGAGTSTDYVYQGSTLLETRDQPLVGGVATGTPVVRYIHTDNLGSTNITSDTNQNRAQWFDYAPYGSVIASTNTGTTTDARQYIGQFADNTGLSYLNARYYNPTQGQFLSEDPMFWGQQKLQDPQSFNAYSYSENNPINGSDPSGKCLEDACVGEGIGIAELAQYLVPIIRAGIVTGAVNTDLHIGSNLVQSSMQSGRPSYTATPSDLFQAYGQGFVVGATAETGSDILSPYLKGLAGEPVPEICTG